MIEERRVHDWDSKSQETFSQEALTLINSHPELKKFPAWIVNILFTTPQKLFEELFGWYLKQINEAFGDTEILFDELFVYRDWSVNIWPYYVHNLDSKRTETQWFNFSQDAQEIMNYYNTHESKAPFDKLILIDNAKWTKFDAMIRLSVWYYIFFNNRTKDLKQLKKKWNIKAAISIVSNSIIPFLLNYFEARSIFWK